MAEKIQKHGTVRKEGGDICYENIGELGCVSKIGLASAETCQYLEA